MDLILKNLSETQELGKKLAYCCSNLKNSCVIYLVGDLGAGKTTLAQNFIGFFGFDKVKSPTYTLVESYQNDLIDIHHFDCYRLSDPEELEYIGIRDYLKPNSIQLIEWPELGKGAIENSDLTIQIRSNGEARIINITTQTETGKLIIACATG
ncbi:MAG: tRNA (adenosine(37)-N6)-threonylcarbamoyltransferase complex ATPase subunit type 1 TsaE [Rhodobacteraceae bacterium]|nr:tRNA (adenosine(37)-N6)-threonylcarbamoyltransferase complex ATPase subunit type 1 TsaE [Paracoccaceae bacterium]